MRTSCKICGAEITTNISLSGTGPTYSAVLQKLWDDQVKCDRCCRVARYVRTIGEQSKTRSILISLLPPRDEETPKNAKVLSDDVSKRLAEMMACLEQLVAKSGKNTPGMSRFIAQVEGWHNVADSIRERSLKALADAQKRKTGAMPERPEI